MKKGMILMLGIYFTLAAALVGCGKSEEKAEAPAVKPAAIVEAPAPVQEQTQEAQPATETTGTATMQEQSVEVVKEMGQQTEEEVKEISQQVVEQAKELGNATMEKGAETMKAAEGIKLLESEAKSAPQEAAAKEATQGLKIPALK